MRKKKADNELNAHHAKLLVATAGRAAMVDQATQTAKSVEPTPRKTICESPNSEPKIFQRRDSCS